MIDRLLVLIAFCIAFTGLVMGLSVRLAHSQEVGCFVFEQSNTLCIPASPEMFVQEAQYAPDSAEYQWIHKNYPRCCNHLDCKPATVKWTPNGWMVNDAEHLVAEKDVIPWPFGEPFACMVGGKVRCLFLNSGG
jgi:hypothetical protein